ncbi:phosphate ABC transporter ATP-binding protein [Candidatus Leptofilum sp.]|uniref:ABC transporter ATP-binding protein n=1 Tax=Candidatus Leptofilum sp. TaxID=3241576 RepID=UPI003B5CA44C
MKSNINSPRLLVKNLSLARNGRAVLNNASLHVSPGEIVCLMGPSGGGKSSLLRCLNRLTEPPPGTVFYNGQDIHTLDVLALRRQVGMVFQKPALFPGTVADNILYGPNLQEKEVPPNVEELLNLADLPAGYAQRDVTKLSGGEAQRVSLARALANQPDTLLMDEPTSALDPAAQRHIQEAILRLRSTLGVTVLWVTHNVEEAKLVADRIYLLLDGRIADEGSPDHVLRPGSEHLTAVFAAGQLENSA